MNNTSTINDTSDSFGWLSELDPADEFIGMEKLEAPPFLIGNDSAFLLRMDRFTVYAEAIFARVKSGGVTVKRKCLSAVEVREYSMTMGDHPCCNDGLDDTLWACLQSMSTGILMKVGYVPEHIECLDECFDERKVI
jgi:hypothetical protein